MGGSFNEAREKGVRIKRGGVKFGVVLHSYNLELFGNSKPLIQREFFLAELEPKEAEKEEKKEAEKELRKATNTRREKNTK